ncbi:MAG: bifunctional adenosylcobinamide kinase/adenosylcobinamide-phosphate guanylyltransferase [Bacilli bacterium]
MIHFVLGGVQSGKSAWTEQQLCTKSQVAYLATMRPIDQEMERKIQNHQQRRPTSWQLYEAFTQLPLHCEEETILFEGLDVFVCNLMVEHPEWTTSYIHETVLSFLERMSANGKNLWIVSSEMSFAGVSSDPWVRSYTQTLGTLHQQIAKKAQYVTLVVAGYGMVVKS